jgi:hypothetical protein
VSSADGLLGSLDDRANLLAAGLPRYRDAASAAVTRGGAEQVVAVSLGHEGGEVWVHRSLRWCVRRRPRYE